MAARTRFSVRASTGAVPFTTRETVAVETPALFATSLMFMRSLSGTGGSRRVDAEFSNAALYQRSNLSCHDTPHHLTESNRLTVPPEVTAIKQTICLSFS